MMVNRFISFIPGLEAAIKFVLPKKKPKPTEAQRKRAIRLIKEGARLREEREKK